MYKKTLYDKPWSNTIFREPNSPGNVHRRVRCLANLIPYTRR